MLAIHQPDAVLAGMDEWNTTTHTRSGLVDRIRESNVSTEQAEALTLEFLEQHVERGMSPMCGNSICQDRRFLHRLMPRLEQYFHYRNLDVSSVKEMVRRWKPEVLEHLTKGGAHLAMDDGHVIRMDQRGAFKMRQRRQRLIVGRIAVEIGFVGIGAQGRVPMHRVRDKAASNHQNSALSSRQ